MICPFDATQLQVVNRSGVDIDWCPSCKGVWLERGELDKLIDLAAGGLSPTQTPAPSPVFAAPVPGATLPAPPARSRRDWDDDDDDDWDRDRYGKRKKRKNLLSEIFDF